jgi:hypothetical protein
MSKYAHGVEKWPYQRGYTTRNFHVTGGRETEAQAAERAKHPSRIGLFVLRLLGYKGSVPQPPHVARPALGHTRVHPHRD